MKDANMVWILLCAAAWTLGIGRIFYNCGYMDGRESALPAAQPKEQS